MRARGINYDTGFLPGDQLSRKKRRTSAAFHQAADHVRAGVGRT